MKSYKQVLDETNAIQVDFLLTDLSAAFTFLSIARTTQNEETRVRNLQNARAALDALERFFPRVSKTGPQTAELQEGMGRLKKQLQELEHSHPQSTGTPKE